MPLLLIEYDDGRILPQALVAVRRRSFLFIERGWNSPIWGYMEESKLFLYSDNDRSKIANAGLVDEYIIRLRGYRENFGPWIERETTILRDSISEVYVTTEELYVSFSFHSLVF